MTSKEILKADLLDILFDNRNKKYGAYVLRKYYHNRLVIALSGMLGLVLIIVLIISLNPDVREVFSNVDDGTDTFTVSVLPSPPPEPPHVIQPAAATVRHIDNDRFEIVDDRTTVPTQTDIGGSVISSTNTEGPDATGPQIQTVENGTGIEQPDIEAPPSSPAPTSAAAFPGGQEAWMRFLNKNLRTPAELEAGQKKTVLVRFTVNEEGVVSAFEIIQSAGSIYDNEVIRVLKKMPKWKPAVQNGRNVSVMFTQPVTFIAFEE